MENVTDRTSNPFGMHPPCERACSPDHEAVYGYGDANADVHVVGDHPGIHGGRKTGIPFTGSRAGERLWSVLRAVGLADGGPDGRPLPENLFASYLHPCCPPDDRAPTAEEYATLEPFFDAELRAITAHVLVPVGDRALERVLREYTSRARRLPADARRLHAREVRGRGFLVVPAAEPADWTGDHRERLIDGLRAVLASDYRQTADLGRFLGDDDTYLVR